MIVIRRCLTIWRFDMEYRPEPLEGTPCHKSTTFAQEFRLAQAPLRSLMMTMRLYVLNIRKQRSKAL